MQKDMKVAAVFFNQDFYWLMSLAIGMFIVENSETEPKYLMPDVDDAKLGETLRWCLLHSRHIEQEDFQKLIHSVAFRESGDISDKEAMEKFGYKTKRAMYRKMHKCSVHLVNGKIEIAPLHHDSLMGYSSTTAGPEPLFVDASVTDAELGAALREGFKRCTSAIP